MAAITLLENESSATSSSPVFITAEQEQEVIVQVSGTPDTSTTAIEHSVDNSTYVSESDVTTTPTLVKFTVQPGSYVRATTSSVGASSSITVKMLKEP